MRFSVTGTQDAGFVDDLIPDTAQQLSWGALESREAVEDEIDLMLTAIRRFWSQEPDQRMRAITAMSARCTEMCIHLHRLEGRREWRQIRTQQVERLLAELDRQFKIASREVELRRQDLEVLREPR
jgi:cytosine/adenosine deaminase-related metal-dependent hydrolase